MSLTETLEEQWDDYRRRLAWQYGEARAWLIVDEEDPATEVDLAAWRALGPSTIKKRPVDDRKCRTAQAVEGKQ